jgi:hypothetical protein
MNGFDANAAADTDAWPANQPDAAPAYDAEFRHPTDH